MDEQHDAHSLKPMIRSMFSILTYDLLGNNDEEQDEVCAIAWLVGENEYERKGQTEKKKF